MIANDYPNLWKRGLIQPRVRERANHKCEQCGMEFHPGTNIAVSARRRDGKPMGTVHHVDGDKQNCSMRNLVYLCQACHCYVQWRWQPNQVLPRRWYNQPQRWMLDRGLAWERDPQLPLFELNEEYYG